jgi:hypothetical protein
MNRTDQQRHQLISDLSAQSTERGLGNAIVLWERLASQIVSIVGENGFNSLYARSLCLAKSTYPWLAAESQILMSVQRFSDLKMTLSTQPDAIAREANRLLLVTFTDVLALLIGEPLTLNILCLAWKIDRADPTHKELKNE